MFNPSNITTESNMLEGASISCYKEFCAQQYHGAFKAFYQFLSETRPARIIEIGTGQGGFTVALQMFTSEFGTNTTIRSYDVLPPTYETDMIRLGIDLRLEDIFTDPLTKKIYGSYVDPEVISFIKQKGTTIVICDGRSKVDEFRLLSEHLKVGDYILAHDYYENLEVFNTNIKNKIWNWNEISLEDISEYMKVNNLVEYKKETFNNVAWVCTKKEEINNDY